MKRLRIKEGSNYYIVNVTETDETGKPVTAKDPKTGRVFNLLEKGVEVVSFIYFLLESLISFLKKIRT